MQNVVQWMKHLRILMNHMITAYGSHGRVLVALKLFGEMQRSNAKLDSVTFISL